MNEQLKMLLQDTVDNGLYQIILSNPRQKDKAFKIKIRPVMVKIRSFFRRRCMKEPKFFMRITKDAI